MHCESKFSNKIYSLSIFYLLYVWLKKTVEKERAVSHIHVAFTIFIAWRDAKGKKIHVRYSLWKKKEKKKQTKRKITTIFSKKRKKNERVFFKNLRMFSLNCLTTGTVFQQSTHTLLTFGWSLEEQLDQTCQQVQFHGRWIDVTDVINQFF